MCSCLYLLFIREKWNLYVAYVSKIPIPECFDWWRSGEESMHLVVVGQVELPHGNDYPPAALTTQRQCPYDEGSQHLFR